MLTVGRLCVHTLVLLPAVNLRLVRALPCVGVHRLMASCQREACYQSHLQIDNPRVHLRFPLRLHQAALPVGRVVPYV